MEKKAIAEIYHEPLMQLISDAAVVHREYHRVGEVQLCRLCSIKTGGCPEDCAYCPQSARYQTGVSAEKMLASDVILAAARKAKEQGNSRFCMGAAWKKPRNSSEFERLLEVIQEINAMDMEVCCTLGMLTEKQAIRLKKAGVYNYNHNLDTGPNYYSSIISTRTYQDRLDTLENVRKAGMKVCCGGILGMGETIDDRIDLIHQLANLDEPPNSVPINTLIPIPGTPLEHQEPVPIWDLVRMVATVRIVIPTTMLRLSAGRHRLSPAEHALCFVAGANSIHTGEKLLTSKNATLDDDEELMRVLGMTPRQPRQQPLDTPEPVPAL